MLAREGDHRCKQLLATRVIPGEKARARDRRVRNSAQPLREIVATVLRIGMRPGVIEHELAVRIGLEIAGCGGDQRVAIPKRQVLRRPSVTWAQYAVLLKPGQLMAAWFGVTV